MTALNIHSKKFENNFEAFESYAENSVLDDALKIESVTKKDNYIYFQLWSNRKDGRGVVYVEDGGLPQSTQIDWICKIYGEM